MNYCKMTDSELASIMVNYILRIQHLCDMIAGYIDKRNDYPEGIKDTYAQIKKDLREDAHQVGLQCNQRGSEIYMRYFVPSIREAAASGFTVPSNAAINQRMFSAVADAKYKLTKYFTMQEWEDLMLVD